MTLVINRDKWEHSQNLWCVLRGKGYYFVIRHSIFTCRCFQWDENSLTRLTSKKGPWGNKLRSNWTTDALFCRDLPQDLKSKQVFCALRKRAFNFEKWTFYWSMVKKNGSSFYWESFKFNEVYSFLFIFTVIIKSAVALLQFPFIFIFSAKSPTDSRSRSAVHRREIKTKLKTFSRDESFQLWPCS